MSFAEANQKSGIGMMRNVDKGEKKQRSMAAVRRMSRQPGQVDWLSGKPV
jgi:hypothetical protein